MQIITGLYVVIFMIIGFAFYGAIALGAISAIIEIGKDGIN